MHKVAHIRLSVKFSTETMQNKKEWGDILKVLKEKNSTQEHYIWKNCPSKMKQRKIKQKLRQFTTTGPFL